jgi:hypothetical protein
MLKFLSENWGNVASVLGLFVSLIGFYYALVSLRESREVSVKAKDAAVRAEEAARATRDSIYKAETIASCSSAISILDEIRRLQREGSWNLLLDRYSTVRRVLQSIDPEISDGHRLVLQGALTQFSDLESKIEKCVLSGKPPPNVVRLNEVVSRQSDKLYEVLMALKQTKPTSS